MSHIGRIDSPGATPVRTAWRYFPWYVAAAMSVVMVVNFGMTYLAVSGFPGLATTHGFSNSNGYDHVLAAAERQAALGWSVATVFEGRRPVVTLAGRDGSALPDAVLTGAVERPVGPPDHTALAFRADGPGRFVAETELAPGRWTLDLSVAADGAEYHTERRLVAK